MKKFTFTLNLDGEFSVKTISSFTKSDAIKRVIRALVRSGIAKTRLEARRRIISCTKDKAIKQGNSTLFF